MKKVIEIFNAIKNEPSKNKKQEIIAANADNELFKKCLKFLLGANVVTGISTAKLNKNIDSETYTIAAFDVEMMQLTFEDVMKYLERHNTGTDEDIALCQAFIALQDKEDWYFYEQMITKKFKLGADTKTVNKAIPNLIPVFNVMLGTPREKVKLKKNEWISISQKLNGTRMAFVGDKCMTRQGKVYEGVDHIIKDLVGMGYSDMFIDGELVYKNKEGLTDSESFQKGTGIAMSKDKDKSELKLVVFDIFPLDEFWTGKSKETYSVRYEKYLSELEIDIEQHGTENIEVVPVVYRGTDHSEIEKWLDYAEEHDWEGCMCNTDSIYETKRTKSLVKCKRFKTCDIRCIDIEEGEGRNSGTLGAIVCQYKDNTVKVGSGFSDEQRQYYWMNPEKIINSIVEVKYKEETKNKDGGVSIQFPIFITVRSDKYEESYN